MRLRGAGPPYRGRTNSLPLETADSTGKSGPRPDTLAAPMRERLTVAACLVFSGASALVYQLIWVRLLGFGFGTTTAHTISPHCGSGRPITAISATPG